jgi:chromosome segregation ATPase
LADDILEDFCSDSERSLRQQIHEVDETKRKIEEVRKENEDLSGHLEALKADWNQAQKELARVTQAEEKLKEDLAEHREHAIRVDKEWKMHTKNIGFIIAWIGQFETGFLPRSDGQLAKQLQEALNFALKNPGVDPLTSIRNVLDGRLNN